MLFRKNILFLLCPEKNILALRLWVWEKISGFLSEENKNKILRKKTQPPAPPSPPPKKKKKKKKKSNGRSLNETWKFREYT